ncbi:MAG: crossover junction endodeoxyribonuclease RuvC [Thermoanaerobaculum sp.]
MRVLGIDPGTRSTGWGLVEVREGVASQVSWGCLKGKRSLPRPALLAGLASSLRALLAQWQPDTVAVETPFVARFQKASLLLAETRGALLAALGEWGGEVVEYEPARVKAWVVGHGAAPKAQVAWFVERMLAIGEPLSEDGADALAVALCHLLELRAIRLQ